VTNPRALDALTLLDRYTVELTELARMTLGAGQASNLPVTILWLVSQHPGITPSELAESAGVRRSHVSRALAQIVADGLVRRDRDPADGRSVRLRLTPAGARRVTRFERRLRDYFVAGTPLVKELLDVLEISPAGPDVPVGVWDCITGLARCGLVAGRDLEVVEERRGIPGRIGRAALALVVSRGHSNPGALAADLDVSSATMSEVLGRLVSAGLVSRTVEVGDRRFVRVSPTPAGEAVVGELLVALEPHLPDVAAALNATRFATL
jgi:DNA-binding MarR family transcriptional regulator